MAKNATSSVNALSASIAELVACIVRVPTELIKQRAQAQQGRSLRSISCNVYETKGLVGLYRGFSSTVFRDIPFAFVEFPVWEALKQHLQRRQGDICSPLQSAACGSASGSLAAAVTTPLDVAKTRIMLDDSFRTPSILGTVVNIYRKEGFKRSFAGLMPRSLWCGLGGFVFFGAYETILTLSQYAF